MFNIYTIATSSIENGFYSTLIPNIIKRVFSFRFRYQGGYLLIATLNPTSSFRAELLVMIYINPPGTVGAYGVALTPAYTRTSHGADMNGLMASSVSILMFFSASTTVISYGSA